MNDDRFAQLPLIGILRGIDEVSLTPLLEAVCAAGLKTIEITMNTPNAARLIGMMRAAAPNILTIGAGTVLSVDEVKQACDNGATFIVSPTFIPEVVAYCVHEAIPVFPGALTPQEIFTAYQAGATMVKVFPAKVFGPSYFKEIKGPFNDIKLLACGGVKPQTVEKFFSCGASAAAFGGSVFRADWLAEKAFDRIEIAVRELVEKTKEALLKSEKHKPKV